MANIVVPASLRLVTSFSLMLVSSVPGFIASLACSTTSARIMLVISAARTPCPITSQIKMPIVFSATGKTIGALQ